MDKIELTNFIRKIAVDLGFDKIGFARAEALTAQNELLIRWLDRGFHGEMRWMEREPEKRSDPRILFPPARSVIVVARNYFTPHEHPESAEMGKISRYAWGDDYHDVMKGLLFRLVDEIKTIKPEMESKVCIDTAPIMDKAWAVQAGLGWIGKHSNLITKDIGSWVFLGEILTDLELVYDVDKIEDHCGTCTKCLDACPTGAIVEPYVVDSNRCISYATIELRSEEMPQEITENLDGWLYGCDVCQDVCPWNRFEEPTSETRFEPRPGLVAPELEEIDRMTAESYAEKFRRSAVKRTKLTGLKRNARALKSKNKLPAGLFPANDKK